MPDSWERALRRRINRSYPGMLDRMFTSKSIVAVLVCGSWARNEATRDSDVDLILVTRSLKIPHVHGLHTCRHGLKLDLIIIKEHSILNSTISAFKRYSIVPHAKLLFCKSPQLTLHLNLLCEPLKNVKLRPEERANFVFHLTWILEKIRATKETDCTYKALLIAKFIYFANLIYPRTRGMPLTGEKRSIELMDTQNKPLIKIIGSVLAPFSSVQIRDLEQIAEHIIGRCQPLDHELLAEVEDLITPISYSEMSDATYARIIRWGDEMIFGTANNVTSTRGLSQNESS